MSALHIDLNGLAYDKYNEIIIGSDFEQRILSSIKYAKEIKIISPYIHNDLNELFNDFLIQGGKIKVISSLGYTLNDKHKKYYEDLKPFYQFKPISPDDILYDYKTRKDKLQKECNRLWFEMMHHYEQQSSLQKILNILFRPQHSLPRRYKQNGETLRLLINELNNEYLKKLQAIHPEFIFNQKNNVQLKMAKQFSHLKLIIIDQKGVFLGSMNMTKSGLNHNKEVLVNIRDKTCITQLNQEFERLWQEECFSQQDLDNLMKESIRHLPLPH